MQNDKKIILIVGLGNPGDAYAGTRHNIGFSVVDAVARKYELTFKQSAALKGKVANGLMEENAVLLLKPQTYMNESGQAVKRCVEKYKPGQLMIVCDDVALPFGRMRMRPKGSSGGHNGLKSVEAHLKTVEYPRLRIGIGHPGCGHVKDYVLDIFTREEMLLFKELIPHAIEALELWITAGIAPAMRRANRPLSI